MRRFGWWARALPAGFFWFLVYVSFTIPDVRPLARENPQATAFMELREAQAQESDRKLRHLQRWVPYHRISGNLKRAVLVAEDSAFWQHEGLDFEQIRESMEVNLERMDFARGASTITQQLAKNLYLSPSRNPVRKLRELFITRRLEAVLSKRRILELYLNLIEWGDGVWGAEAASRAYFGKPAASLSPEDAALLAGAIINPRVLNPASPNARLARRQRLVLRRMGRVTPPPDPDAASGPESIPPVIVAQPDVGLPVEPLELPGPEGPEPTDPTAQPVPEPKPFPEPEPRVPAIPHSPTPSQGGGP